MQTFRMLWLGVAGLLVAGCAAPPQNPAEFRQLGEGGSLNKEEIVSSRSFAEVTATFKKMVPKCLNVTLKVTYTCNATWCSTRGTWLRHYKPALTAEPRKLSLDLSREWVLKEPQPAYKPQYIMAVDVFPLPNGKSRAVVYYPFTYGTLLNATKGWMSGENMGCPDLTELK